jgi:hypothetical protein
MQIHTTRHKASSFHCRTLASPHTDATSPTDVDAANYVEEFYGDSEVPIFKEPAKILGLF